MLKWVEFLTLNLSLPVTLFLTCVVGYQCQLPFLFECLLSITFCVRFHCLIHHGLDSKMSILLMIFLPHLFLFFFELMPTALPCYVGLAWSSIWNKNILPEARLSILLHLQKLPSKQITDPISNIFLKSYHKANCKSVVKCCSIYWNSWDDSRAVQFAYNAKLPKIIFPLSLVSLAIFLSSFLSPQATRVNSPMGYPFIALRTGILPLSWSTSFSKIRTSDEELF